MFQDVCPNPGIESSSSSEIVSVIVPFLNGSHWLIEALESVLHQTYSNWELLIMDDGSDEKHSKVARDFCSRHSKTIYLHHEGHVNKGVSVARNEAAKHAQGKYLAFLDADDVWKPGKLQSQLHQFHEHPQAQAVCDGIIKWYSWNSETANDYVQPIGAPPQQCYQPARLLKHLYPLCLGSSPAPSGIMIKREAFIKIGGFEADFSGIYELYEDQAFLSKLYLNANVYISSSANVMYRKRDNSMSSAANDATRYYTVRSFYLNWLEQYMNRHSMRDKEVLALIHKARKEMSCDEVASAALSA